MLSNATQRPICVIRTVKGTNAGPSVALESMPAAVRYEVLPEEGLPSVTTNNHDVIDQVVGGRNLCAVAPGIPGLALAALLMLRRRRTNA